MPENMMSPARGVLVADSKTQKSYSYLYAIIPAASLICLVLFFSSSSFSQSYTERISSWRIGTESQNGLSQSENIVSQSQNMDTQSQNMTHQNQNIDTQSQNMINQSQNVDTQSQNMINQSQDVDTQSQNMTTQNQDINTQSQNMIIQSQDVGTQSQNMVTKSQDVDTKCKNKCRPNGSEALPAGIVSSTSNFEMRHLWDPHVPSKLRRTRNHTRTRNPEVDVNGTNSLFAMAVGIKQKDLVNKMVQKFLASGFVVMLLHYDGIVDEWKEFEWNDRAIHVSAISQTKWWFAKRFLHPDIVATYDYIFLWDEDLGVDDFNPEKYVSIIKSEGLEISQPALDPSKSEVHHQITARGRGKVHRRTYKAGADGAGCDGSSTKPPCTGWIEMMAPVFSRVAWRCVWYMIQNDLIHAWGLDMQLGYCAQGDRTRNVGVVDAEYIIHYGHPTLGGVDETAVSSQQKDHRVDVRRLSYRELDIFRKRWQKAVEEDQCWIDPFQ